MNVLISSKRMDEFEAEEYLAYVKSMYALRIKGRPKKAVSTVPGLNVVKNKKGTLSIRRSNKLRTFKYVTREELVLLAKSCTVSQSELWNAFKKKDFLITETRMEAELLHADINSLPF